MLKRQVLAVAAMVALTTGCALDSQKAPALAGPSELSVSLGISASPDFITQDGVSRSVIDIQARDGNNQPMTGLTVRVETAVDGTLAEFGSLSSKTISTNGDGRASVVYTAPPPPPAGALEDMAVAVILTPVGGNYGNSVSRTVVIRLARPSVILPPSGTLPGAPVANFFFSPSQPREGDTVLFDASTSTNAAAFSWNFGDGHTGSGVSPTNAFDLAGTYTVTLTVTSDQGATHSVQKPVQVSSLASPTASFVFSPEKPLPGQAVFFNGAASKAPAGRRIANWEWDFGDGSKGSGETTQHTYANAGGYVVVLKVTDDTGRFATFSLAVTVALQGGPTAKFEFSPSSPVVGQQVFFNAQTSTAEPGRQIVSWSWNFGNGFTGNGETVSHIFAAPATYTVTLKVTDDAGKSSTVSRQITINP